MAPQPSPSVEDQSTENYAALADALIARLAAEIPLDRSNEELARASGRTVAEIAAFPPLDAEQERQIDRITWQSPAHSCISAMVHVLFDAARQDPSGLQTRFVDEDLERIAAAHISAPFSARHFGLDAPQLHRAAELTVELFRDRARFADPTFFTMDGLVYIVQRRDDDLFVLARR
ncbi:hypothetical protein HY634_00250 [Candidatus Uhrbacteria bacterium]|nr:hypothetical protein [Candidatus Uhrbacteria bacterium]